MAVYSSRYSSSGRMRRPYWMLLIPLTALFMHRWLGSGLPLSPRGESQVEIGYLWVLRRLWAQGDGLRGWNPFLLSGVPTATGGSSPLFLVLTALSHLLGPSPEALFRWTQCLATLLSATGMYLYMRHQAGGSFGAGWVAAVVFAFFPARAMLTAESLAAACAWATLPWILWAYERARLPVPLCVRPAIVWGLVLTALALTSGEWLALLIPLLALYIVSRELCAAIAVRRQGASTTPAVPGSASPPLSPRSRLRAIVTVIPVAALVVLGLSLFHHLPRIVERPLLWIEPDLRGYPGTARWTVSPALWLALLRQRWSPGFEPLNWDVARVFPNITWYLGAIPGLLAAAGLLRIRLWPRTLPLAGVLAAAVLLMAGPAVPRNAAYFVVRRLPFISRSLEHAFRYVWPASFGLAALAGLGVDRLGQMLGIDWRVSSIGQLGVGLGVVALVLIDFWPASQAYGGAYQYLERDEIEAHQWLDETPGGERYWVPFQIDRAGRHYTDTSYGPRYNRRPSISVSEYRLASAPSRAPLFYGQVLQGQIEQGRLADLSRSILDLANVRYLVLHLWPGIYREALTRLLEDPTWRIARRDEHVAVLENLSVRPYAHAYAGGVSASALSDEDVLQSLPRVLARGYALVETGAHDVDALLPEGTLLQPFEAASLEALPSLEPPELSLALARPKATDIWLRFKAPGPFLLMISETWYPHWQVYVNGERHSLLRLNGNFAGVYVDAHEGHVLFRYRRPLYHWLGLTVSVLTALGLVAYAVRPQPVRLRPDA